MEKSDLSYIAYGLLAGILALSLPVLAAIQFNYWPDKGYVVLFFPIAAFLIALFLLHLVIKIALIYENHFTVLFMGLFFPAGLLPFLGVIAFQENSADIFIRFMVALLLVSFYMIAVGKCIESYERYGFLRVNTLAWAIIVTSGYSLTKWTSLSEYIGVASVLNERLQASLNFLKSAY